jgi:hypothetical protein
VAAAVVVVEEVLVMFPVEHLVEQLVSLQLLFSLLY